MLKELLFKNENPSNSNTTKHTLKKNINSNKTLSDKPLTASIQQPQQQHQKTHKIGEKEIYYIKRNNPNFFDSFFFGRKNCGLRKSCVIKFCFSVKKISRLLLLYFVFTFLFCSCCCCSYSVLFFLCCCCWLQLFIYLSFLNFDLLSLLSSTFFLSFSEIKKEYRLNQ